MGISIALKTQKVLYVLLQPPVKICNTLGCFNNYFFKSWSLMTCHAFQRSIQRSSKGWGLIIWTPKRATLNLYVLYYSCWCRGKTHQHIPQLSHISSTPIPTGVIQLCLLRFVLETLRWPFDGNHRSVPVRQLLERSSSAFAWHPLRGPSTIGELSQIISINMSNVPLFHFGVDPSGRMWG